jgi:hypothetical protein
LVQMILHARAAKQVGRSGSGRNAHGLPTQPFHTSRSRPPMVDADSRGCDRGVCVLASLDSGREIKRRAAVNM